jgi:signal transduction histidine kinase
MKQQVPAALRSQARRPLVQDAALAAGLLVVCVLVNDPYATVGAMADGPLGGGQAVTWLWWVATAVTATAVVFRRRLPLLMLVAGTVSAGVHMAVVALPTVIDLGVLVLLYTVAAHGSRVVSLPALGGLLLLITGWSAWYALDGRPVPGLPSTVVQVGDRLGPPAAGAGDVTTVRRDASSNSWNTVSVLGLAVVAVWLVGSGVRNRRAYLDQLHARAQDLERERDQQAALATAAERGRISREMHDVVAHGLSVMVIQAQGGAAALDNQPADTRAALDAIVKTGRDSLADMRRVLGAMGEVDSTWRPSPGLAQLPALLAQVRRTGTPVRLRIDGAPVALPSAVDLSAYRVAQEALTNTMKHADSGASVDVFLTYGDAEIRIEVSDDGQASGANDGGGNGLRGMHERVKLLGGRLSAGPGPHGGFTVRATLPIESPGS